MIPAVLDALVLASGPVVLGWGVTAGSAAGMAVGALLAAAGLFRVALAVVARVHTGRWLR